MKLLLAILLSGCASTRGPYACSVGVVTLQVEAYTLNEAVQTASEIRDRLSELQRMPNDALIECKGMNNGT